MEPRCLSAAWPCLCLLSASASDTWVLVGPIRGDAPEIVRQGTPALLRRINHLTRLGGGACLPDAINLSVLVGPQGHIKAARIDPPPAHPTALPGLLLGWRLPHWSASTSHHLTLPLQRRSG